MTLFPACSQAGGGARHDLAAALDEQLSAWQAGGGSGVVHVRQGGEILFERGYGLADREAGRANTPDTPYDIGSLVKEMTFLAIYQLDERGLLSIDDTLDKFFEDIPGDKKDISLEQILFHTSGLQDIVDGNLEAIEYYPEVDATLITRDELIYRVLNAPLLEVPEGEELYSNFGYGLLAVIVEDVSGLPYEQYIIENIFKPAGMTETGHLYPGYKKEEVAVGYQGRARWGTTLDWDWPEDGPTWMLRGSGGMYSRAGDLAKLFDALGEGKLVGKRGLQAYYDYFSKALKSGERYALSFGLNDIFEAGYFWAPERDAVIIVFSNDSQHGANRIIGKVWSIVRDATEE